MSNSKTLVTVRIADKQGELEIIGGDFGVKASGFGLLNAELEPGIYKARARAGSAQSEELFAVEPGAASIEVPLGSLSFATPVPLQGTSTSHEYHQHALAVATGGAPMEAGLGQGATLLFSIRDPSDACIRQRSADPGRKDNYLRSFAGFRLRGQNGELLLNFDEKARHEPDWGFAVLNLHLRPACYVLSFEPEGVDPVAMPVLAVPGWQSQLFFHVNLPQDLDTPGSPDLNDRAVMMAPVGMPFQPDDRHFRLTEIARFALLRGRSGIANEQLDELLREKFFNPIHGLFAVHLLLLKCQPDRKLLDLVANNLAGIVGNDFPDLMALRIASLEMDGDKPDLSAMQLFSPPLLRASWDVIARYPELLPEGSFVREIASRLLPQGTWLAWKPSPAAKSDLKGLADTLLEVVHDKKVISSETLGKIEKLVKAGISNIRSSKAAEDSPPAPCPPPPEAKSPAPEERRSEQDDASATLATIVNLALRVPWDAVFRRLRSEAAERGLFSHLSSLQKSLLPTLQLIRAQLEEDDDFTLDELEQLCKGLNVPLAILRETLEDLGIKIYHYGLPIVAEERESPLPLFEIGQEMPGSLPTPPKEPET